MRPSYVITVDPSFIDGTDAVSGAVLLGVIDELAYVHVAPNDPPRRFFGAQLEGGALVYERELAEGEEAPEGATVLVVGEQPPFPWGEEYTVVYDPSPEPFQWDAFAAAEPALAEQLMPNQWFGE
jgi:hypothetical protein